MSDITIIYYTSNYIDDYFAHNVRNQLLIAASEIPIISVSQKPLKFGKNICVGDIGRNVFNIYKQILIGTIEAKTKYVAMAEDDVLYCPQHFREYRPQDDVFGYNINKWGIYTWVKPPVFNFKDNRHCMTSLIAPRNLLIEALEERFKKYSTPESLPDRFAEPGRYEDHLGVTIRKKEQWRSSIPNIIFSHEKALAFGYLGTRKKMGDKRVDELPYWGNAKNIRELYERS